MLQQLAEKRGIGMVTSASREVNATRKNDGPVRVDSLSEIKGEQWKRTGDFRGGGLRLFLFLFI
jgi:hypothetical protein